MYKEIHAREEPYLVPSFFTVFGNLNDLFHSEEHFVKENAFGYLLNHSDKKMVLYGIVKQFNNAKAVQICMPFEL